MRGKSFEMTTTSRKVSPGSGKRPWKHETLMTETGEMARTRHADQTPVYGAASFATTQTFVLSFAMPVSPCHTDQTPFLRAASFVTNQTFALSFALSQAPVCLSEL